MNVLWLRPDKPDNISVGRHRIATELRGRGHEITVENTTLRSFGDVLGMTPDAIVGTTRLGAIVGTWKKAVAGTPLVIDNIDPIGQLHRSHRPSVVAAIDRVERVCFGQADHVLVVYDEEVSRVRQHTSAVTQTELGVDYRLFNDPPADVIQAAEADLAERLPADVEVVTYIGGLEPEYHLTELVEAVDRLEGWHLLVLGDGSQRAWLEQQRDQRPDVHFPGTVPYEEVPGYLHASDVGISLLDDPNTLKVLEYGSAGLPVVQVEGSAEARFGDRVEYCSLDPESIADAIQAAVQRSDAGLETMAADHDWSRIADTYESVLEDAIGRSR